MVCDDNKAIDEAVRVRAVLSRRDKMAIKVLSQAEVSSVPVCGKVASQFKALLAAVCAVLSLDWMVGGGNGEWRGQSGEGPVEGSAAEE